MLKVHCYRVNGSIHAITYSDFIELYNNKKTAQQDWQYCKEQIQLNPKKFGNGRLFKFVKDSNNIFYFVHAIPKDKLKKLIGNGITNQEARNDISKVDTQYKVNKEEWNEPLNCYVKEIYPAKELIDGKLGDLIIKHLNIGKNKKKFALLDGDEIKISSDKLRLFKTKGIKCYKCGKEGKWFYKCRNEGETNYYLQLFTEDFEIINKDHITPISLGGADSIANMQPMCYSCNQEKGNSTNIHDRLNGLTKEELCVAKLNAIRVLCEQNLNSKMDKKQLIKEIKTIILSNDERKIVKDKSLINKLSKIIGLKG